MMTHRYANIRRCCRLFNLFGVCLILLGLCITLTACAKGEKVKSLEGVSDVSYLPVLINTLKDPNLDTRCKAAEAIAKIGPEAIDAIPALVKALEDNKSHVQGCVVKAMGAIGPEAKKALVPLYAAAFGRDVGLSKLAYDAIKRISPDTDVKVLAISKNLTHPDPFVRRDAAKALYEIQGSSISGAYPALKQAIDDEDKLVRQYVVALLKKLDNESGETEKTLFLLKKILKDPDTTILQKREACEKLGQMGDKAVKAVPDLVKVLLDKDNWSPHYADVRYAAVRAIGDIGPKAKMAASFVIREMKNNDFRMRIEAMRTVGLLQAKPEKAVPILIELLDSKATVHKKEAIIALGRFGPKAKGATSRLAKYLSDPSDEFRLEAAKAIGNIGPDALAAVPALLKIVNDNNNEVRSETIKALGKIGLESFRAVLPVVLNALHDDDAEVRLSAVDALSTYEIPNIQVLEGLQILSNEDKSFEVRNKAAEIVAKLTSSGQ